MYRKRYPDLQKRKTVQKRTRIAVKSKIRSGTVRKNYHELKGRAGNFHKFIITFRQKLFLAEK